MESQIWRVQTEKIGSLESFKSERDMESFLMNNPAIVGCWDPESELALPSLRQQVGTTTADGGIGIIDLVGICVGEKGNELRLFELKNGDIDVTAVEQIGKYLKGWEKERSAKSEIKKWILELNLQGIDEKNVDKIIDNPVGVLVGTRFLPEAITKAMQLNIQGIRLARFRAETKSEYFVIVEDQVGKIVRRQWCWNDIIKAGLIEPLDVFSISHKGIKLLAIPDQKYLDYYTKKIIFDEVSTKKLLGKKRDIIRKAKGYDKKWLDNAIESLKKKEGLFLSNATGLCYLAFGGPTASYWNPTWWWKHEKSGKSIDDLKNELNI